MKTIGMIGGISWESTHEYYHLIIKDQDCELPLFNTTRLHAEAVVKFALT